MVRYAILEMLRRWPGRAVPAALILLVISGEAIGKPADAQVDTASPVTLALTVDTLSRTYRAIIPPVEAVSGIVLAFHGGSGGTGERLRGFIGPELESAAGERGFLVVYPDGVGGSWNGCRVGATNPAKLDGVDDVSFVRAMIRDVRERFAAADVPVFALGYSNGAHLAFRLALEMPGEVAAIAVFGANLPVADAIDCAEHGRPVAAMIVNGTADPINPFAGGDVRLPDGTALGRVRSAMKSFDYFGALAGYESEPSRKVVARAGVEWTPSVVRITHAVPGRPEVTLYVVRGGGHTIPSATADFPEYLGPTERGFSAAEAAVEFFDRGAWGAEDG